MLRDSIAAFLVLFVANLSTADDSSTATVDTTPPKPVAPENIETDVVEPANQYEVEDILVPPASADEPVIEFSAEQASHYLEQGATAWTRDKQCITCHTNGTYLLIRPALTPSLGAPSKELREFFIGELPTMQEMDVETLRKGTRPAQVIYLAAGLAQWDAHTTGDVSPEADAALRLMLQIQEVHGAWGSADCWPPFESSAYQEATMGAMAITANPAWLPSIEDTDVLDRVTKLKSYLSSTAPPHDYARVLKLWTSIRMPDILAEGEKEQIAEMILGKQQSDGGWSLRSFAAPEQWGKGNRAERLRLEPDFESPSSDGHMTGLALIVLQQIGYTATDPVVENGVTWLRANQRASGRWWTRSLNTDDWHYITYSGTAYAMLALQMAGEQFVTAR
jgi:squalene-hopene/tetraprenyl-beta-curcumene cyclase